jgi:hydroxymethylbilane synthase
MDKVIRIGTRSSELALWQAKTVAGQLEHLGHQTEIVEIDSIGDVVLDKPLYELGITGVFTKNLDIALLNGKVDIAVHSLKDVPTKLPKGIVQAAVLKRGDFNDVLLIKDDINFFEKKEAVIATGSLRRKAQWLYRYPTHTITGLRGNVNTRLRKLEENPWDGAIFAMAGLKRLDLLPRGPKTLKLDWMVPAPAQGAVMVATLGKNEELREICRKINDEDTALCVRVEREFLRVLEGGCTAPIGALAMLDEHQVHFKGVLFSRDGSKKLEFQRSVTRDNCADLGRFAAQYILDRGGKKLMREDIVMDRKVNIYSTKVLSRDDADKLNKEIGLKMADFITVRSNRLKGKEVNSRHEGVIITSKNAVEALLRNTDPEALDFGTIFCVGKRTKKLIERRIGPVMKSKNSARKLAEFLIEKYPNLELTYFCGNLRRDELPDLLSEAGVAIREIESYQTLFSPQKMEDTVNGILFYSPSGITSFLKLNKPADRVAFCIGETTATEARKHFKEVVVTSMPTTGSLIKSVNQYYNYE